MNGSQINILLQFFSRLFTIESSTSIVAKSKTFYQRGIMGEKTVTINGMVYDQRTGMPLRQDRSHASAKPHAAGQVHTQVQRSKTLNRKYVAKHRPDAALTPRKVTHAISVHKPAAAPLVSRSESISRFAKEFNAKQQPTTKVIKDFGPTTHPVVRKAEARVVSVAAAPAQIPGIKPSHVIKQEAIADAMNRTEKHDRKKDFKQPKTRSAFSQALSVGSASLAVLLLGGYFTYLSMPSLSTRVAAAQAGIDASYPNYHPSGYSLNGPVAFNQGTVSMKFAANAGPQSYTLSQTRSGWDSSAVLNNYVEPKAGDSYSTTTSNGLTIYTYDNNAAWVNAGILYTISGDAPLSHDQIQRIATSL